MADRQGFYAFRGLKNWYVTHSDQPENPVIEIIAGIGESCELMAHRTARALNIQAVIERLSQ